MKMVVNSNEVYDSYIVDFKLPPATIILPIPLAFIYLSVLCLDYVLIRNDTKLASIIAPTQLRLLIFGCHFMLPILFETKHKFLNISYMLQPWSLALQVVFLAKSDLTFKNWLSMLLKTATFQDDSPTTEAPHEIRKKGFEKTLRGVAKYAFMKIVLDRVLPKDYTDLLAMPFFDPKALFFTYIFAVRIYCMMGLSDLIMGIIQSIFLIRFKDIFDNPFIASSPKDFWNKRWNRLVSNLFRQFVFTKVSNKNKIDVADNDGEKSQRKNKKNSSIVTSRTACGIFIFFISGLFHDLMVTAVSRTFTLELTAFFLLHGIAVALEVNLRTGKYKQDPTGFNYITCHLLTVGFFAITGRLFLNCILRQPVFLMIAQRF